MRVGRSHKWRYDAGEWSERKVTPDRWEFRYAVVKRRAGRAPEGSGAPLGTAYHWYIVADQVVTKLDANSYMTEMVGHKLKVAHRRAERSSWSASEQAKRKHLAKLLRELASDLESTPVDGEPAPGDGARGRGTSPERATHKPVRTAATPASAHRTSRAAQGTRQRPLRRGLSRSAPAPARARARRGSRTASLR
ncbi:MAG: hypothetical protein E6J91_34370 [Deltaproteobacteria bacterium]|nr:MAG: hypothetical protein E6J91_34370 [Deltaproteobacteria bacterium]